MYRVVVYGDNVPLMDFEYETLEEAEDAREGIWVDIVEEDE